MKKILYISTHEILEKDELTIFTELGYEVFSIGYWMDPSSPKTNMGGPIEGMKVSHELIEKFNKDYPDYSLPKAEIGTGRVKLKADFLKQFDLIINCWYQANLEYILKNCDKPVIHRTIDIIDESIEAKNLFLYLHYRPFYLVRMNEQENLLSKIKSQATITQCVNKNDFDGWAGEKKRVFTTLKGFNNRPDLSLPLYENTTSSFNRVLCGSNNESVGDSSWVLCGIEQEKMIGLMRESRVNYVQPRIGAAMVYSFIEGLMCGCPVVTYNRRFNGKYWSADQYIKNGVNGYVVGSVEQAVDKISLLMDDLSLAQEMSIKARETAMKHFEYGAIKQQWKNLLDDIGV